MTGLEYDRVMGRREFLRSSVVAGSLAALSGCAGVSIDDVPGVSGSDLSLRQYAYAPDAVDKDAYGVALFDVATIDEIDTDIPDEIADGFESRYAWLHEVTGVDFDDATTVAAFDSTVVMAAEHSQDDVDDELDEAEFDDDDEMNGFTLYQNGEETRSVAIDGSTIVGSTLTGDADEAIEVLETTLDTRNGDEDRYADETPVFGTLLDSLDGGAAATGHVHAATEETNTEVGTFEDERARGVRATFDVEAETTTNEFVLVFEEGTEPPADDIREWTATDLFTDFDSTVVSASDTVATIEATTDLEGFTFSVPEGLESLVEYIPAPSTLVGQETYPQSILTGAPEVVTDSQSDTASLFAEQLRDPVLLRLDLSGARRVRTVRMGGTRVSTIDGDVGQIVTAAEDAGFTETSTVGDVRVLSNEQAAEAIGVTDALVITARESYGSVLDPAAAVETVAGTATGETPRYTETNENLAALYNRVGAYDMAFVGMRAEPIEQSDPSNYELRGMVGSGAGFEFQDAPPRFEFAIQFQGQADVPQERVDAVVDEIRNGSSIFADGSAIGTQQTGQFLVITGELSE